MLQPNKKMAKQISDHRTKILGVSITSRYSRGKTKKPRSKKGVVAEEIDYLQKFIASTFSICLLCFMIKKREKV